MTVATLERRRAPRVSIPAGTELTVPVPLTVRLIDISASGVLLLSPQRLTVGQRASLQLTLGGEPFSVELEIRRVVEGHETIGRNRYRLGASFVAPTECARRSVERFLRADAT